MQEISATRKSVCGSFLSLNEPSAEAWRAIVRAESWDLNQVMAADDPAEMACRAWRMTQSLDGALKLFERISNSFAASLERCDREVLGLARATIEAGRQKSLLDGTSDWLLQAKIKLDDRQLEALDSVRWVALRCLANIYQADELRSIGAVDEAKRLCDEALEEVPLGESEIRSRVFEIASLILLHSGDTNRALERLLEAERLLIANCTAAGPAAAKTWVAAGRLAEIRLSQARVLTHERRSRNAQGILHMALDALPDGRDLRLELEIKHELLGLHVTRGEAKAAQDLIRKTDFLYGHAVSDPLLRAERDRLRGRLAFDQRDFAKALMLLFPSIDRLITFRRYRDALIALDELHIALNRCSAPGEWQAPARRLLGRFLTQAPGIETAGTVYLQALSKLARYLDVDFELGDFLGTRPTTGRVN